MYCLYMTEKCSYRVHFSCSFSEFEGPSQSACVGYINSYIETKNQITSCTVIILYMGRGFKNNMLSKPYDQRLHEYETLFKDFE